MKAETKSADDEPSVEHISDVIGEWGGYQRHYVTFITFASMVASLHNLGYAFHSPKVEHWCADVPAEFRADVNVSKCHSFLEPERDCLEWRYDHRHLDLTIVEEVSVGFRLDLTSGWIPLPVSVFCQPEVESSFFDSISGLDTTSGDDWVPFPVTNRK